MKLRIIAFGIILLFQNKLLFAQTEPKNQVFWVNLGITKLFFEPKFLIGLNYNFKPDQIIGLEYYQFGGSEGEGFFRKEIPNQISETSTIKLSYGYQIPLKSKIIKIIPNIGFGYTHGLFRTNELDMSGSSSLFSLNFNGPNYIETPFSGVSFSPQLDFMIYDKWFGVGILLTHNATFAEYGKTFSTNNIAFKICIGKFK